MLGRNHIALSVLSVALVAAPVLIGTPYALATLLAGVALGALLPDLDQPSMRLVKSRVTPLWLLESAARKGLFLVMSVLYRLLLTRFDASHRGSLHTLLGVALYSVLIGGAAYLGLTYTGYWTDDWRLFLLGIPLGGVLHLVEDSCTRWGVAPFSPLWEHTFRGGVTTGNSRDLRPEIYAAVLFMGVCAVVYLDQVRQFAKVQLLAGVALVTAWAIFFAIAKIPLGRRSDS